MPLLVNQGRVFALVFLLLLSAITSLAQKGPRGFNQLFDSTSWSSNTGVRLNPQAISFVEGYLYHNLCCRGIYATLWPWPA